MFIQGHNTEIWSKISQKHFIELLQYFCDELPIDRYLYADSKRMYQIREKWVKKYNLMYRACS